MMGFLALIPAKAWEILAVVLALGSFGGYMYYRGGVSPRAELSTVKAQFEAFQGQVKVVGEQAQKAEDATAQKYQAKIDQKDKANETSQTAITARYTVAIASLRRQLAHSGAHSNQVQSPAIASTVSNGCADAAGFSRDLGEFETAVLGQILEPADRQVKELTTLQASWPSP